MKNSIIISALHTDIERVSLMLKNLNNTIQNIQCEFDKHGTLDMYVKRYKRLDEIHRQLNIMLTQYVYFEEELLALHE